MGICNSILFINHNLELTVSVTGEFLAIKMSKFTNQISWECQWTVLIFVVSLLHTAQEEPVIKVSSQMGFHCKHGV